MSEGLEHKHGCVWITGASSGIGRATALALARAGRLVAASARRADELTALAREAEPFAGSIHPVPLDVTQPDAVAAAVAHIEADIAPIETAILSAGNYALDFAATLKSADVKATVGLNLFGAVYAMEALIPLMIARGGGRIVAVGSLAAYRGLPHAAAYGASKAGLLAFCEALRPQLMRDGIILQVANPGFVATPLTDRNDFPMPFLISADDAARAMLAGLRSKRFEIVFPRRFAWLMKTLRMLPYALFFFVTRRMVRPQ
ncbi:MAG: SDR family NAD(P)-dependent oxidoreductase [Alphaproteobacteria bacterium]|nr:SDR family NAD(P)-dependent oxidoreductase [Alphaproteobacteria bacterium]